MNDASLTDEEFNNMFFPWETNKSPGYDNISFNDIFWRKYIYIYIYIIHWHENCTNYTQIKGRDIENAADYKAISVLQCFLKKSQSSS